MKGTTLLFSELYPESLNDIVYRYSSPVVFQNTLSNMSLRFTRGDCFNDYEDGEVVKKLYIDCLSELIKEEKIDQEFFVAAAMTEIKHLVWLVGDDLAKQIECKPFICCFSEEKDSLQMWQYYSKSGSFEGYNLGFRLNELVHVHPYFVEIGAVVYDEEIQKRCIKRSISTSFKDYQENVRLKETQQIEISQEQLLHYELGVLRSRLAKLSCFFKRPCFSGEKEIRVVIKVPIEEKYRDSTWSGKKDQEKNVEIKYRIQQALMIPYIELPINPRSVECVTIGPITSSKNIALEKNADVVNEFVTGRLGRSIPVLSSSIPVRF